jgi:hypothetical protein
MTKSNHDIILLLEKDSIHCKDNFFSITSMTGLLKVVEKNHLKMVKYKKLLYKKKAEPG